MKSWGAWLIAAGHSRRGTLFILYEFAFPARLTAGVPAVTTSGSQPRTPQEIHATANRTELYVSLAAVLFLGNIACVVGAIRTKRGRNRAGAQILQTGGRRSIDSP